MASESGRLALPFIEAGQAQKEWAHNEALALIDIAVQASVEDVADAPPADVAPGKCWIVGGAAAGAWAGHAGAIAGMTTGGWRFVPPREGMAAWHLAERTTIRYRQGAWRLDRAAAIAVPAGGDVVDAACRAAVGAILAALSGHGLLP